MASIVSITGIGPTLARLLADRGIATIEDLAAAELANLLAVPGIGPSRAASLTAAAKALSGMAPMVSTEEPKGPGSGSKKGKKQSGKIEKSKNTKKKKKGKKSKSNKKMKKSKKYKTKRMR